MAESVVQPVLRSASEVVPVVEMPPEDEPEVMVLGHSEDSEWVGPSFEGGPGAGPSEWLPTGGAGAMVQHGVPSYFNHNEWEEEEV